jgi:epoxyqueuosine reductase
MNQVITQQTDLRLLSARIKDRAKQEGFDKIGIVPAHKLETEEPKLREWLARSYQGEMTWMSRDAHKRTDPTEIFPGARSVVVVAINYYTPQQHSEDPATGKVSRYAWGDDYHEIVGDKLRSLLAWIQNEIPAARGKVCVDIQPMMDKAWAVRAGLGWLGKHTNVITQEFGSWVFIGELLLNLELDYDTTVVEDHCGTCTLCIDACPTQAIVEPYVLDARQCISYATIELRTPELPATIASNLEGWIYGCDICQDVCPWNRFEVATTETRFEPRAGNINTNLREVMEFSPEAYAERYRHSAMKRAKLGALKRNAKALLDHEEVVATKDR